MAMFEPTDEHGKRLSSGDVVSLLYAPPELLNGLPEEDQRAIRSVVGAKLELIGFDEYGHAEIEFRAEDGNRHTIWVNPSCLALVSK